MHRHMDASRKQRDEDESDVLRAPFMRILSGPSKTAVATSGE